MAKTRFPIRDIQFHLEGLRTRQASASSTRELHVVTAWHSTAIAFLQFGAFHNLDGPGAERMVDGVPIPARIEEFLILRESDGNPYFSKKFKES